MSALTDLLLTVMDPVSALLIIGIGLRIQRLESHVRDDIEQVRGRVERVEDNLLASDGGTDEIEEAE